MAICVIRLGIFLLSFLSSSLMTLAGYGGGGGGYSNSGGGYSNSYYKNRYVPAPPQETPKCAKYGATYCEKIQEYPSDVIRYLLEKWGNTYQDFVKNEKDEDFFQMSKTYGYGYGPPSSGYGAGTGGYSSGGYDNNNNFEGGYNDNNGNNNGGYNNNDFNNNNNNEFSSSHNPYFTPSTNYNGTNSNSHFQPIVNNNNNNNNNNNQNQKYNQIPAAAIPPIIHSIWWNHRDQRGNYAYPHMMQHQNQNRYRRFRIKRQTTSESQTCPVRSQFIAPRAAMNNQGNWMYVVNMGDSRFVQQVKSENCFNGDGSPCSGLCSIPTGFLASCRQQYVQKRLIALSGSGDRLLTDVFWFPHCCICQISQTG